MPISAMSLPQKRRQPKAIGGMADRNAGQPPRFATRPRINSEAQIELRPDILTLIAPAEQAGIIQPDAEIIF